jgi:hypothetical protein
VAAHETHMSSSLQSRGPATDARITPIALKIELRTAVLKRYLRIPPRYRAACGGRDRLDSPCRWENARNPDRSCRI